ncbi:MAG: ABC transporter permease subunit [Chloroflexi bacterium]|nr:ABC transporter permease subunit [Chloroflexota bacterium]
MSGALFRATLTLSRWAVVGWAVFLALYGVLIGALFPSVQEAMGAMGLRQYIESMPEVLKTVTGVTDERLLQEVLGETGMTFPGYLAVEYLSWWPILVGTYAFLFCSGIVAREVERGTMELLLSQPVARWVVVASKFLAFGVIIALVAVLSVIGIGLGQPLADAEVDLGRVLLALLQGGLVVVAIGSYSLLISCVVGDPRKAAVLAGGVTAALYVVNFLGPLLDSLDWVQRLSIFYYYRPLEVLTMGEFHLSSLAVYMGVAAAAFAAAVVLFERRRAVV